LTSKKGESLVKDVDCPVKYRGGSLTRNKTFLSMFYCAYRVYMQVWHYTACSSSSSSRRRSSSTMIVVVTRSSLALSKKHTKNSNRSSHRRRR